MTTDADQVFANDIANRVGQIKANIENLLERNPDLPVPVRRRLADLIVRCMPLADVTALMLLRRACDEKEE